MNIEPQDDVRNNAVARAINLIGEKWTLWLLREAFYGVRRFEEFRERLGIPRDTLSRRLKVMVEEGLLERVSYKEDTKRQRSEYCLTDMGRDLLPALVALLQWGDTYLADEGDLPLELRHRSCGALLKVDVVCSQGHVIESAGEISSALKSIKSTQTSL